MKEYIAYTIVALIATIAVSMAAADKEAIIAKEKAVWQAFKDKKEDDLRKLLSPDVVAVYADGIVNMQERLGDMSKNDMKSFSLSDFHVLMPDAGTAIIAYKSKMEGASGGKDVSGDYNCGTVWNLKNGEWRAVFHSDMKQEVATGPTTQ